MSYILLLLCLLFLFYKFDKAVCFFVAFYPLMSMVGLTNSINLFQVIGIISFIVYFVSKRYKKDKIRVKYPFYLTLALVSISYLVSNIMTIPHWPTTIALIIAEYALTVVFWNIMWNETNRKYFYLYFITFITIVCVYCVFEFLMQRNPLYDWYVKSSMFIGYAAERIEDIRFGSMRCHSIMRDVGALGTVCCIAICILFYRVKQTVFPKRGTQFIWLLIGLCAFCTLLTGTRTVILAMVMCFAFLSLSLEVKKKIRILFFLILIVWAFSDYFAQILLSFTDTQSVSGSSTYMRELQIAVVMNTFKNSPIYGLGLEGTAIIINKYVEAYGLESIWFQTIINYGILGALAFSISILQGFYYSVKNKNIVAFTVVAMFLLVKTMSSIPGIGSGYFLYIIIFLIISKTNSYKQNENRYYNHA